jgi:nucleoside-diphosphate-sugar epimerase
MIRLNYAVELRYGVLVDIARKIESEQSVDVTMGYFNCIWQRDANDMIVRALDHTSAPGRALNLTGEAVLSVRALAQRLGKAMGRSARITGEEAPTALLSDASEAFRLLGRPETSLEEVIDWTAQWVAEGRPLLGKPTHFEVRDGAY